jgi:hypothetical protein
MYLQFIRLPFSTALTSAYSNAVKDQQQPCHCAPSLEGQWYFCPKKTIDGPNGEEWTNAKDE